MTVRFPIAPDAETALSAPLGRAAREREAGDIAGKQVEFVREMAGPPFETAEAALAAHAGRLDGPGLAPVAPEDRYCELVEVAVAPARGGQAEPVFQNGHRWPKPKRLMPVAFRLSVGYWRPRAPLSQAALDLAAQEQARATRRRGGAERLSAEELRALAQQPLRPFKRQQPLDIGLFEVSPPEAPHILMPDE